MSVSGRIDLRGGSVTEFKGKANARRTGIGIQCSCDDGLVFDGVQGACGVNDLATGLEHLHRSEQDT